MSPFKAAELREILKISFAFFELLSRSILKVLNIAQEAYACRMWKLFITVQKCRLNY